MYFKDITIIDEGLDVRQGMHVGTEGDRIAYIGAKTPSKDYGDVYNGKGKLLMSAFYNAHAHSPMTLLRGYGENMSLQAWLNEKIFPFEEKLRGSDVYWGTLLAMAESIRYGIVSTTDMYYFCDSMAQAVLESGAKDNISRGMVNFSGQSVKELPSYAEIGCLYKNCHNAGGGKIKIDMSIHAEYTTNPETVSELAAYAKELGVNMHLHLSETSLEHEECKARHGMTPAQYFNSLGAFDAKATAAHCVWLEGEDFDILAQKGVTAATCPASNMKLASGICNVPLLLQKGVNVAIGTDSVSSNNNLNFIEEMKFMACSAKVRNGDPTAVTPKEAIHAATKAGAASQCREDCGALKVGNKADVVVFDVSQPHMSPVHDILTNLVYSASGSDVVLTMSDGKVLYKDGEYKTIDVEKAMFETERSRARILSEL
ncbi:MAG: amidohydrolase [Clostridiales bacterium]|nr:amidohydrolase [Clostridiales bacterium]